MSREILFRGKRMDNGEWVEGFFYICTDNCTPKNIFYIQTHSEDEDGNIILTEIYDVDPETVGQYIGMTDENEKQIFEGDIFNYDTSTIDGEPIFGKMCIDSIFNYELLRNMEYSNSLEVIGNIFDNKELVEGKNE